MSTIKSTVGCVALSLALAAPAAAQQTPQQQGQSQGAQAQQGQQAQGQQAQGQQPQGQQPQGQQPQGQQPQGQQAQGQQPQGQQRARAQRHVRTIRNLRAGIQGETNAAHRYDLFARRADQEDHHQVAKLFRAAAVSERIHRRNQENALRELGVRVPNPQPERVRVGSTRENLLVPIRGEREEAEETYPEYIRIAVEEDVPSAVEAFTAARETEAVHDELFQRALANLGNNPEVEYYAQTETGMLVVQQPGGVAMATPNTQDRNDQNAPDQSIGG